MQQKALESTDRTIGVCYGYNKSQCSKHKFSSLIAQEHLRELQNNRSSNKHTTVQSKTKTRQQLLEVFAADGKAPSLLLPKDVKCNTRS